jgi:hypothetical protein
MEVQLEEDVCKKKTAWGVVERSLGQHIVRIKNDEGKFVHCGYVGEKAFLPLCGFPAELVDEVANACEKQLGRKLERTSPPPSLSQIAEMLK